MLRPDQQSHTRALALGSEQFVEVRLPVTDAENPGLAADLLHRGTNVGKGVKPAFARLPLRGLRRALHRRIEAQAQHAERKAGVTHRQCRVQVQAQGRGLGLVLADHLETVAARPGGEVQVGAVLDGKHRALAADAADAALAMRRQDVLHRDRRLRRLLDQPVEGIDRRAVAVRTGVDLVARIRGQQAGALHKPRRQSRVTQGSPSEFILRPLRSRQAFPRFENRPQLHMRDPEFPPPAPVEREHEHRLHRLGAQPGTVLPAPARRPAHAEEIGRPQAGASIALIGKTLHQQRAETVTGREVAGQAPQDTPQHVTGQVRTPDRGPDQEAVQAQDPVKLAAALAVCPCNPAVAGRNLERRCREPRRPQPAMGRAHQVPELAPGKGGHAVGMLMGDQRVPQRTVIGGDHRDNRETLDPGQDRGNLVRVRHRSVEQARGDVDAPRLRRRQHDIGIPGGKGRQGMQASRHLKSTDRVDEGEFLTDPATQGPPAVEMFLRQDRGNPRTCRRVAKGAADLGLCHNDAILHHRNRVVQPKLS